MLSHTHYAFLGASNASHLLLGVVSSGTGRRGTLRDAEIEISFPPMSDTKNSSDWPAPFPALIRIVHLYGRVADLLNSIKEPSDVTTDTTRRLAAMETQVTNFYQGLSPRLHFDAVSFQHYMKNGEGTNFVLLHFWFHMLIVLLHQPTLLKTFEGHMLQLFPNSQQLSMSSAKTIADILSYSQLMDAKASLGNPFTTQPIYIAACAFLKETAEQTASSTAQSRASSPNRSKETTSESAPSTNGTPSEVGKTSTSAMSQSGSPTRKSATGEPKSQLAKHSLLATAASQHYQLCYKALQSLETYWAGTKYILTILDQKFQGVEDPLLYTTEEGECSMEQPRPEPSFTSPGWRRKLSWGPYAAGAQGSMQSPFWSSKDAAQAPSADGGVDPSKGEHARLNEVVMAGGTDSSHTAIGWTLTGTMNSPSTNLAWHYATSFGSSGSGSVDPRVTLLKNAKYDTTTSQIPSTHLRADPETLHSTVQDSTVGITRHYDPSKMVVAGPDADPSLNLKPAFSQSQGSSHSPATSLGAPYQQPQSLHPQLYPGNGAATDGSIVPSYVSQSAFPGGQGGQLPMNFLDGDMMIESQDVDMSMLGLDMMPWFDSYPTHDLIGSYPYDPTHHVSGGAEGSGNGRDP